MKAAVVGLGIGHAHCAGYLQSPHAELAAVCDLMPGRLARVGGTFEAGSMTELRRLYPQEILARRWEEIGVRTFTSLEELLEDPGIEIVSLCTPDHTHAELAVRILRSGRHLLMEKPLALSLPQAEAVGRALSDSGSVLAVDYEFRLNPAIRQLRRLIEEGITGEVEAFTLYHFRRPFKRDKWQKWIQRRESSGGLIVEETSHWLDLLRFLTGREVASLSCRTNDRIHPDFDFEDIAFIQGSLSAGGIFQISHALSGFDFSLNLAVHGRKATAWCHLKDNPASRLDDLQSSYCALVAWGDSNRGPEAADSRVYGAEALEPQSIKDFAMDFARCIAEGRRPAAGYEDALRALELALAAREAAAAEGSVSLSAGGSNEDSRL
ncbi:MAG: Gfo/Idh/MocA family oxidoreductase [Spirochaetales bacterium]|nr:Gfo/Idh/MocA family oxidoreductase [Spirochaetales bacterium]